MTARLDVELQINLAPPDLPHARWILPHQLRCWADQVDSIQLTVDLARSHGHYAASWAERRPGLIALLEETCRAEPRARVVEVDYSESARSAVADAFFGGARAPAKDAYGAPFHAYLFALLSAHGRYLFHMDSDMLYGGGSPSWVADAIEVMQRRSDVLLCNPLPGPPTSDGMLRSQTLAPDQEPGLSYRVRALSTRLYLIDTLRLASLTPIPLLGFSRLRALQCALEGRSPVRPLESCISSAMETHGLWRVDTLGPAPGSWAVHPPYRSQRFYDELPLLVRRVETGDVPEDQRGRHDLHDSLMDWSDVRPTRASRLRHHAGLIASRMSRARAAH